MKLLPCDLKPGDVWFRNTVKWPTSPVVLILDVRIDEWSTWLTWVNLETGTVKLFTYSRDVELEVIVRAT